MLRTTDDECAQVADDGNLRRLKKIRGGNRAKATKLINEACEFMNDRIIDKGDTSKSYVCLFTCAATRAVHLELVTSLSVETFICAFRRFCARRGLPALIITDNAKTFKSASKEVKRLLRSPRLSEYFMTKGVRWRFIPELSPFQGGFGKD